jgi:hypothetical protein
MLHDYPDYFPLKESRIGNTSFKKIVKVLTTQDLEARKAMESMLYSHGLQDEI